MSALDYFAFAYLGVFVFYGFKCKLRHLPLREGVVIFSLIPIILLLFISADLNCCLLRCAILSLPIKFDLLDSIYNYTKSLKRGLWLIFTIWIGMILLELFNLVIALQPLTLLIILSVFYILAIVVYVIFQILNIKNICIIEDINNPAYIYALVLINMSLDISVFLSVYSFLKISFYIFIGWTGFVFMFLFHLVWVLYSLYPDKRQIVKKEAVKRYYHVNEEGVMNVLKDGGWSEVDEDAKEDMKIIYALLKLFDYQKPYRRYDIKVNDVASMIGTNKTYLSRALNRRLSKNFSQFVNAYRIKDVCEAFIKDSSADIRDIADNYGFNSQSNFSVVFKCHVGHTPSDWCKEVRRRIANNEIVKLKDYDL